MMWQRIGMVFWLSIFLLDLRSQDLWDGEGNDGRWSNPLNWSGNMLPSSTSRVVLNNLYVDSNFVVVLDTLAGPVIIGSLEISPGVNRQIKLVIPSYNKFSPALSFAFSNSLVLQNGSALINSSGASSGTVIILNDSVCIYNGGRYVHNTPRAHASFVSLLSRKPGTEQGVFEFDVPNASNTVSLSDRVFGKLVFSSKSAGGASNYTASGTRKVWVRSDLELVSGARLNLNFTDTLSIDGSLLQENATLNVSSGTRNLVVQVNGDIISDSNSNITESGSASGKIILAGKSEQQLDIRGKIEQQVSLVINNIQGVELISPLNIETTLELKKGKLITDHTNPLVIRNSGLVLSDSLLQDTYVDGPIILESVSKRAHTLVPVGRFGLLRWMALKDWSGQITTEFIRSDPRLLSSIMNGVDHVSTQGYWKVSNPTVLSIGGIELSFPDPNFSGVTDLNNLTGARLSNNEWIGQEIIERKGSAGSNGSVTTGQIHLNNENYFSLASLVAGQNPLPVNDPRIRIPIREIPERKIEIKEVSSGGNSLQIKVQSGIHAEVEFYVFNELGQMIYKQKISVMKGKQNIYIRLPLQTPRIYHIFGLFWGIKTNTFSFKS